MIPTMHVATLYTDILQDPDNLEIGNFHIEVLVDKRMFLESGDKPGMLKSTIARYLASSIMHTQVPMDYWRCNMNPEISRHTGIPAAFSFGTRI
jgi:hypothetical protein